MSDIIFYKQELEMTIIGNLMLDSELPLDLISSEDFYFFETKKAFDILSEIKSSEGTPDLLSVMLIDYKVDNNFVSSCTDKGIVTSNYKLNCKMLKQLSAARKLHNLGLELKKTDYKSLGDYLKKSRELLDTVEIEVNVDDDMKVVDLDKKPYEPKIETKGFIPTGFDAIDEALNDLAPKRVTLVTGRSHEGKTTFVRQVIAKAIDTSNKTLWIMGENEVQNEIERLYESVIGREAKYYQIVQENKKYKKVPRPLVAKALSKWHKGKLRILHKAEAKLKNTDELFTLIEKQCFNYKPNLVVIDNLMSVLTASAVEKLEKQGEFMQKCCDIAKIYNMHIILVLHPNKSYRKGLEMDYEHISGTNDLPNKADNIIVVRKAHEDVELASGISGYIDVIKNKVWGTTLTVKTYFDKETNSILEYDSLTNKAKKQSFDIEKYIDVEVEFYNGEKQTFSKGEIRR